MAYTLPTFNLSYYVTQGPVAPADGGMVGAIGPYMCQRYVPSRPVLNVTNLTWWWGQFTSIFRVDPQLISYLGDEYHSWNLGYLECPADSGKMYRVFSWTIMHEGFSNAYAAIAALPCLNTGIPIQPGTASLGGYTNPPILPNMGPEDT